MLLDPRRRAAYDQSLRESPRAGGDDASKEPVDPHARGRPPGSDAEADLPSGRRSPEPGQGRWFKGGYGNWYRSETEGPAEAHRAERECEAAARERRRLAVSGGYGFPERLAYRLPERLTALALYLLGGYGWLALVAGVWAGIGAPLLALALALGVPVAAYLYRRRWRRLYTRVWSLTAYHWPGVEVYNWYWFARTALEAVYVARGSTWSSPPCPVPRESWPAGLSLQPALWPQWWPVSGYSCACAGSAAPPDALVEPGPCRERCRVNSSRSEDSRN